MLPQIIIADGGAAERCKVSLGHYRLMLRCDLNIVAGLKWSFVIAIMGVRVKSARDTKSSNLFSSRVSIVPNGIFFWSIERDHLRFPGIAAYMFFFHVELKKKGRKSYMGRS